MERLVTTRNKFGRSCTRCKIYFVTENETNYLCPWCQRIVAGKTGEAALVGDDSLDL